MLTQVKDDAAWEARIAQLGQIVHLEASARWCGAMLRRRRVHSAAELLRLCLAYLLGRLSFAAHPRHGLLPKGGRRCRGVAVLNRLRASADRPGALAAALLTEHYPEVATGIPASNGRLSHAFLDRVGTLVDRGRRHHDGATGRQAWLLARAYRFRSHCSALSGGGSHQAQRAGASRSRWGAAGRNTVADRGHARADDLALVVAGRADVPVHVAANCPRLIDQTGHLVDRLALCQQATREKPADRTVVGDQGQEQRGHADAAGHRPARA